MRAMSTLRWIAYIALMIVGAFLIVTAAHAGAGPWLVLGLMVALVMLGSLIDPVYWGWRDSPRRR